MVDSVVSRRSRVTEILSVHLEVESKLDRGGDDEDSLGTEGTDELLGPRSEVGSECI